MGVSARLTLRLSVSGGRPSRFSCVGFVMKLFRWTSDHIDLIADRRPPHAPLIAPGSIERITSGFAIWDHWPVLDRWGGLVRLADGMLVVALSAPVLPDPDARHAMARLRLLHLRSDGWRDLGNLLPDGLSPGSREWAGSAMLGASGHLTLYFTAAGTRGDAELRFDQRLFATSATLGNDLALSDWTPPVELIRPDGIVYEHEMTGGGASGTIKAFRDPFFFHCPQDSNDYLLFAASRAGSASAWNGLVGLARREGESWTLAPPIVDATGLNNELERPHAIVHQGRTYLFWSTQAGVFAPGIDAPTGLYGLVADRIGGPWRPLNGHGLVFSNPHEAPEQAYSWHVLPDLSVWSFANMVDPRHSQPSPAPACLAFTGAPAPSLRLTLDGDRAELALDKHP